MKFIILLYFCLIENTNGLTHEEVANLLYLKLTTEMKKGEHTQGQDFQNIGLIFSSF